MKNSEQEKKAHYATCKKCGWKEKTYCNQKQWEQWYGTWCLDCSVGLVRIEEVSEE